MTFTRTDLAAHIETEFADLISAAQLTGGDGPLGFGAAIDRTFRTLGVTDLASAGVVDASAGAALALGEYYALLRIVRALAIRSDVDDSKTVYSPRAQVFQQAKDLLTMAEQACAAAGYPVSNAASSASGGGGNSFSFGRLSLDWTEPETLL